MTESCELMETNSFPPTQKVGCVVELEPTCVDDNGTTIRSFELRNGATKVCVCNLGASILRYQQLCSEEEEKETGESEVDIVLGYKDVATMYRQGNPVFFSCIVGRVANRIRNGKFQLNGQIYELEINNFPNHLHGGSGGFSHCIWKVEDAGVIKNHTEQTDSRNIPFVRFTLDSPDCDQGYPGHIKVTATYSLRKSIAETATTLRLEMKASLVNDSPSLGKKQLSAPINLAQHSYFNLEPTTSLLCNTKEERENQVGPGILDHVLQLDCDHYTPVDEDSIPTKRIVAVRDDPTMNFTGGKTLRQGINSYGIEKMKISSEQSQQNLQQRPTLDTPYGFDHNFVVRDNSPFHATPLDLAIPKVATLTTKHRKLIIHATTPGVQVYTSNYLNPRTENDSVCKATYGPWSGICLETQYFPDSIISHNSNGSKRHNPGAFEKGKCPILSPEDPHYEHSVEYTLFDITGPRSTQMPCGSDTLGRKFDSVEAMWAAQDLSSWYRRSMDYYEENCMTTVDGVLGGIGWISDVDIEGSAAFLERLELPEKWKKEDLIACECGAGIGRVTKGLLLDVCAKCDLIESSGRLLSAAPDHIGLGASNCRFYCIELQDWRPSKNKYALVWIQWCAIYLTDAHVVELLKKCAEALIPGGYIVLKENTCSDEAFVVDVEDASITRSLQYWHHLIFQAGLCVVQQSWQAGFPDDIFPVPMLALQPIP